MREINHILIVGGGTSGWVSAAYLAKKFLCGHNRGVKISLVESSDIPIIGVGEAGIPNIRELLAFLEIDEAVFIKECAATFKQGIKFTDWLQAPGEGRHHSYYHLFGGEYDLAGYTFAEHWLKNRSTLNGIPFSYSLGVQSAACDAGMGPKQASDPDYQGALAYSYHFDAGLLVELLKRHAVANGVNHLIGEVSGAELDERGYIAGLNMTDGQRLEADLFIDCTGFAGHLIEGQLKSPFTSVNDILFVDRALAVQIPYDDNAAPIPSFTESTAKESGWIWRIPLVHRIGTGYVYSSKYTDDERAEQVFREHIGPAADDLTCRKLKMRVGYRERPWVNNCVAVGLSAGFLEPLESTGIYLVQFAVESIASLLPQRGDLSQAAHRYNQLSASEYKYVMEFIKLHYCLSRRTDSDFWIDNAKPQSIPESLANLLESSKYRVPQAIDFCHKQFCFHASNYHQILYGMEFDTDIAHLDINREGERLFRAAQQRFQHLATQVREKLPDHRALVEQLHRKLS